MTDNESKSRRGAVRQRVLKEAKVVLSDWTVIDCLLRNMSDTGACLKFGDLVNLPEAFRLLIVSTNMLVPSARMWQRGELAGIRFTGPAKPAPPRKF